jgi:hypothetical protein
MCWPITLDRVENYWTVLYSLQVRCMLDLGQGGRIEVSGRIVGAGGQREGGAVGCHHTAGLRRTLNGTWCVMQHWPITLDRTKNY